MPNRRAKNRMKEERYIVTSSKDEWCMRIESIIFCVAKKPKLVRAVSLSHSVVLKESRKGIRKLPRVVL